MILTILVTNIRLYLFICSTCIVFIIVPVYNLGDTYTVQILTKSNSNCLKGNLYKKKMNKINAIRLITSWHWFYKIKIKTENKNKELDVNWGSLIDLVVTLWMESWEYIPSLRLAFASCTLFCNIRICRSNCSFISVWVSYLVFHSFPD